MQNCYDAITNKSDLLAEKEKVIPTKIGKWSHVLLDSSDMPILVNHHVSNRDVR